MGASRFTINGSSWFEEAPDPLRAHCAARLPSHDYISVIARSEATKQSIVFARRNGLLRFARNDVEGSQDGFRCALPILQGYNFCPTGKSVKSCLALFAKIFRFTPTGKSRA
jgi:sporulation-control protein spo0M